MLARFRRLLDHGDRKRLAALFLLQLRETQRGRHPGGTAADDQDVNFEGLSIHSAPYYGITTSSRRAR
jgi:hypothetical protein